MLCIVKNVIDQFAVFTSKKIHKVFTYQLQK